MRVKRSGNLFNAMSELHSILNAFIDSVRTESYIGYVGSFNLFVEWVDLVYI